MAKPLSEQAFPELFDTLKAAYPTRQITYEVLRDDRFVLAGRDAGKAFYLLFYRTGTDSVGFSLSWNHESVPMGAVVATYVASYFQPL